jgi:hypothetical protein
MLSIKNNQYVPPFVPQKHISESENLSAASKNPQWAHNNQTKD